MEIVVIGKPEEAWGTGLGLALIASLSVLVPVSLVAAAPARRSEETVHTAGPAH